MRHYTTFSKMIHYRIIGPYEEHCVGFGDHTSCGADNRGNYLLAVCMGTGTAPRRFHHIGSNIPDSIIAFDSAEVDLMCLGQINMSRVSSFCGPQGLIWGYDVARSPNIHDKRSPGIEHIETDGAAAVPVYSIWPLIEAARKLFGTRDQPCFPIKPGSHVPCAGDKKLIDGPGHIYSAIGIGIAKHRTKDACVLMEDLGEIPFPIPEKEQNAYKEMVLRQVANSIIAIGDNQNVEYSEILTGVRDTVVKPNEIGCALVAAPYFLLARRAASFLQADLASTDPSSHKR